MNEQSHKLPKDATDDQVIKFIEANARLSFAVREWTGLMRILPFVLALIVAVVLLDVYILHLTP
jgi:hypothetical protein